jgi:uncharacterized repeat protein (TIGR03847 family)
VADSFELDPVDWISAGAIGEPGSRTFYLQARKGSQYVALVVEKTQVAALAQLAQQLLNAAGITVTPDDLDERAQRLVEPVEPAWRAGALSLGADEQAERFLLEAEALVPDEEEGAVARFWMGRQELIALTAYAAYAITSGARERCRFCSRPIDPVTGHVCPATNGHGPLTV